MLSVFAVGFGLAAGPGNALAATPAIPIPPGVPPYLGPHYVGQEATPRPISAVAPPQNPYMTANGKSNIHNDAWMSDTYTWGGPLGRAPETMSTLTQHECGALSFDSKGRLVAVCISVLGPRLYMFDPDTLATLAQFALPTRDLTGVTPGSNIFQDFTGGGYFFLDNKDRVWTPTTTRHVVGIAEDKDGPGFHQIADFNVSVALRKGEKINSALPDWSGRMWFVTKKNAVVGNFTRDSNQANPNVKLIRLAELSGDPTEEIVNSFTIDTNAIYVVTNRALYRLTTAADRTPKVVWKRTYANVGHKKPGQVDDGSGTTPTILPGGYVAITDNADPMNVVVYRKTAQLQTGQRRQVCAQPVFKIPAPESAAEEYASATENSLVGAGRSLIVENNYGYDGPTDAILGKVSSPGFARIDVNADGTGCRTVWTNLTERAPSVVPKLSLANGLIYAYTKDPAAALADPWFWTTLDFRTGKTVYKQWAGDGIEFNNNYAAIILSPSGTAYLGVLGGVVAMRDGDGD